MTELITLISGSAFYQFAALLALAAVVGGLSSALRQPLIIAFIAIGILAGPSALGIVSADGEIALLAKLGIAILLFIVGLKLDLSLIKSLGATALLIGSVQMVLTVFLGAGISMAFGYSLEISLLVGVSLAFSSTIIVIKLLSDKREIDSLHGRIALGVLIIQDLAVVVSMIVLAAIGAGAESGAEESIFTTLIKIGGYSIILLGALALFMKFAAMRVMGFVAKNTELLLIFAIAWGVGLAALCDVIGLSKELGGLLAGISLASTPYRETIMSRLASLRDFLLLFFFVALGAQIDLGVLDNAIMPALILSVFVMLFKPLIILSMAGALGYTKRTGFLAGLSLAQISEFSLIFAAMAFTLELIDQEVLGLITMIGLITIIISTYLLSLSQHMYSALEPFLGLFEKAGLHRENESDTAKVKKSYDVILIGLGRYGQAMAEAFLKAGKTVLAVDFNPEEVRDWRKKRCDAVYGDAADPEFYHTLPLKKTRWVVSALPQHRYGLLDQDPRLIILSALKEQGFQGKIALSCHHPENVEKFRAKGADLVFLPFHDAAQRAVNMVIEEEEK